MAVRNYIILFLALLLSTGVKAVNNDSLVQVFHNTEAPLVKRLQSLTRINWLHFSETRRGIELLDEAIGMTEKSADLDSFKAYYVGRKAWLHDALGEFDLALRYYREGLDLAKKNHLPEKTLDLYVGLSDVFKRIGELDSSLKWIGQMEVDEEAGSLERRSHYAHVMRGVVCSQKQQYRQALDHYFQALEGEKKSTVIGLIAICYKELGITDSAIVWHRKTVDIRKAEKNDRELAVAYYNIAVSFGELEMLDSCAIYGYKAYQIFKDFEHYLGLNLSALLISELYSEQGQYDKADEILNETVEVLLAKEQFLHAADVYMSIAWNDKKRGLTKQATETLEKALELVEPNTERFSKIHATYGDFLKEINPNEALRHYAISRSNQSDNQDQNRLFDLTLSVAEVYVNMQNSDEARRELNSLPVSELSNSQKIRYYNELTECYKQDSEWDSAFLMVDLARAYTDSVYIQKEKSALKETLAKYSVELAENKRKLAESEARNQRRQKYFGFILLGLSIISIVWIRRNHIRFTRERAKATTAKLEASEERIKHARDILENQSRLIIEKNRLITELNRDVELLAGDVVDDKKKLETFVESRILTKEDWERFKKYFEAIYPGFLSRMKEQYPNVTEGELRMLCLVKLDMSNAEMGDMLGVLPHSVKRTKNRFKAKYNIEPGAILSDELNLD